LFTDEAPDSHKDKDFKEFINPDSLQIINNAFVEPSLKTAELAIDFNFNVWVILISILILHLMS